MYSLLGFVHVLLMLTQSRYVPDLSFIWRSEAIATTATVSKQTFSKITFQLPVEKVAGISFEMVRTGDKEKLKHSLRTEAKVFIHIEKIKRINRVVTGNKLYLVFGQLKADG